MKISINTFRSALICLFLFFLIFIQSSCTNLVSEQTDKSIFFGDNDRVCFVGNSITNGGKYHHNILLYYMTRFPGQKITTYNCGVSGDVTGGVINRMDEGILINNPTHVVVMLGMNDVRRGLYKEKPTTNTDTLKLREDALTKYNVNMEKIIGFFLLNNIKVILQKPTIYDQTAILPRYNNFGVNEALKKCADFSDSLAVKYNLQTVDYWTIMNRLNREMQEKDSSATITCEDRIHPRHTGHFVMAYQFLKTENAPKYVSKIVIDSKKEKSTPESENCEINEITKLDNGLSFTVIENALPFPTIEEQEKALQLVPFMDELNVELLQILNLKQGQFKLSIDNVEIGNFTAEQFAQGINLAEFQETPQYQQAKQLLAILEKLWEKESALRSIKFIEYNPHYKNIPNKENLNNVGTFLDSAFTANYTNPYYKSQLKRYITNKPQEANFLQQSDELREEAFRIAQVKPHYYKITIKYSI